MSSPFDSDAARLLRSLAFHIHRKVPAVDALTLCLEEEGKGGRHKKWRQPLATLEEEGFTAALLTGNLIDGGIAAVLEPMVKWGDHRLLSSALENLAEYIEADS